MSLHSSGYRLPQKWQTLLVLLTDVIIELPPSCDRKSMADRFLERVNLTLNEASIMPRLFLRAAFFLFDSILPHFIISWKSPCFRNLPPESRKKYFLACLSHRFFLCRDLAKALRGLVVTLYFSDEEIWREIEYDPKAHIQTRIEWRQKFLRDAAAGETST